MISRADGVNLSGTLYLPAGYDKAKDGPLPMLMWAYPTEFTDASVAGQVVDKTRNRFVRPQGISHLFLLTQGYAVFDGFAAQFATAVGGLVFIETAHLFPIVFFAVAAALANIDASHEQAARMLGAGRWRTTRTITLPAGGTLQVTIPPGVEDGQILRLRGKGAPSPGEGEPGDALVQIVVRPHRAFARDGDNILLDLPITVKEAALGAEVRTPTTTGSVMLRIPKRSSTGDMLRLRGKGVKKRDGAGDELVKLKVMMPTEAEPELEAFLANWTPSSRYDPRKEL